MEALNRKGHEYYSEMPKHIRKRWSENFEHYGKIKRNEKKSEYFEKVYPDFRDFMLTSFEWKKTEEGSEYWVYVSYQNFEEADRLIKPKTSIGGTITFILVLFLILAFYALIWQVFFNKGIQTEKPKYQKFVPVTVWEKADTLDMIYANKNYKGV
jgi:hypothetical protein